MKRVTKFIKKHLIPIWIVVAILGIASVVTFAEYMAHSNRAKRVAANVAGAGQPFDSNYLATGSPLLSNIPFPAGTEGNCPIDIKIWNYNRANTQKTYKGPLTYDLVAQLVNIRGELLENGALGSYQIGISSDGGTNYTYFSTYDEDDGYYLLVQDDRLFAPNASGVYEPTEHGYVLSFPTAFLTDSPGIYVKVSAIPSDTEKLSTISAIFGVTVQEETLSRVWEGRFNEDTSRTDYDSFNYVISGSGESSITFSWCTDYLQVNEFNLDDYSFTATNSTRTEGGVTTNWKTITITANSSDTYNSLGVLVTPGKSRYDFQLYMTTALENSLNNTMSAPEATYTDYWDVVNSYVDFSATSVSGE
ncbi:hypothetical protein [Ruminococcus albus]|uniref:Uncharacterized protein n=1 Tax=Ruminococcus albus TaxID=1264 RepID=A0A1I1ISK9_RUMAL|nr:hypothetical protein [Ruminococcus albus]SFC39224.1 hypothetical protein SAMN02910406_01634 [Ruminococcus albus]